MKRDSATTLIELLGVIAVIAILAALTTAAVCRAIQRSKETVRRIEIDHYARHLPFIDEVPFHTEGRLSYYTNPAFPGVLFTVDRSQ